jgi:hypothetical protein
MEQNGKEVAAFAPVLLVALIERVEDDKERTSGYRCYIPERVRQQRLGLHDHGAHADVAIDRHGATDPPTKLAVVLRHLVCDRRHHARRTSALAVLRAREEEGSREAVAVLGHGRDAARDCRLARSRDAGEPEDPLRRRVRHPGRDVGQELSAGALEARRGGVVGVVERRLDGLEAVEEGLLLRAIRLAFDGNGRDRLCRLVSRDKCGEDARTNDEFHVGGLDLRPGTTKLS